MNNKDEIGDWKGAADAAEFWASQYGKSEKEFRGGAAPSKAPAGGPAGNLLAEVQAKALAIGGTFKHVEKNSNKKNPDALPEVPVKKAPAPVQAKAPAVVKEPKKEMKFNTWYLENYGKEVLKFEGEDDVSPSYGFVLINCKDTQVVIVGKCKQVMLEACTNVKVVFDSVVTSAEVINCKKITFTIKEL